ncbi:hypothetical protein LWI29_000418 [Acer saccharum]|uniref:FCP1 homology domain-containing protein n=1 Tax=Acer saccharum TaxID=4024 RepID=A0AA39S1N3_ACESA|nr:hypothetical protein LWI29_000418 [Acer saccharum]
MAGKLSENTKKKAAFLNESDSDSEKGLEENSTGLSLTKLNLGPKKKLVVLSLGGLLCHRVCRKDRSTDHPIYRIPDASYGSFVVYKRPYCTDFIKFCLERFEVGIWWYMSNALDCIMVGLRSKVLFAWPNTAVFPTDDYKANHVKDDALGPKGELRLYLEGLVDADDVPSYVKNHTFGQPAITSVHPDWDFYSNIIRKD